MNDGDPALRQWFGIVTATLQKEDLFIRNFLQPNSPRGIRILESRHLYPLRDNHRLPTAS